ncbi:MAG TPA: 2-oxoacid:acceptor oxidoreductase family protein [bacterium]|nr:2-oxoacid:acceptor oxidoreductase family protein [bacterium]HOL35063.1 2-oxoacid:acceptor oxidoreductase family protein [bacterium]HPP08425.1 2-oxoacid:acceptor oxidoreductase family protein [bacterium]
MKEMFEIRWHGRGGQGAKTAALLFGDAACSTGKYIQAFPEYGPERMGAPVVSFNRISSKPIRTHGPILNPDVVVVLDVSLVEQVDVTAGLDNEKGIILLNSSKEPAEFAEKLKFTGRICTVDASRISIETIGREIPNTPMMGALIRVTGMLDIKEVIQDIKHKLEAKFRNRPEIIEGNIKAIEMAYNQVKMSN